MGGGPRALVGRMRISVHPHIGLFDGLMCGRIVKVFL